MISQKYENPSLTGLECVEFKVPADYLDIDVQPEVRKMVWNSQD